MITFLSYLYEQSHEYEYDYDYSYRLLEQEGQGDQAYHDDDFDPYYFKISLDRQRYGEIAPRISGTLSAVSSILIIFLILRSLTNLSSSYHRIMMGMSTLDVLSSTAMALTHLPMPRPGLSPAVDSYAYEGLRLGNAQTCAAQGYFFSVGILGTYTYNAGLCIYYACAIYFKLKKRTIRNWVESVMHLGALTYVFLVIPPLFDGNINPIDAHCGIAPLPNHCNNSVSICERGDPDKLIATQYFTIIAFIVGMFLTCTSLGLVCWTVFAERRKIKKEKSERQQEQTVRSTSTLEEQDKHLVYNNFILFQCLAYIGALLITLLFPILITATKFSSFGKGPQHATYRETLRKLQLIFQPMQGFFNFLIFMSSKIYQERIIDRNQSYIDVVKKIFTKKYDDPIIISSLSFVEGDLSNQNAFEMHHHEDNGEDGDLSEDDSKPTDLSSPHATDDEKMDGISYPSSGISPPDIDGHSALSPFSWFSRSRRDSAVSSTGISHGPDIQKNMTDGRDSEFQENPEIDNAPNNTRNNINNHAGTRTRFKRRSVLEENVPINDVSHHDNNNNNNNSKNNSKNNKKKKSRRIDEASDPPITTRTIMKRHSSFLVK